MNVIVISFLSVSICWWSRRQSVQRTYRTHHNDLRIMIFGLIWGAPKEIAEKEMERKEKLNMQISELRRSKFLWLVVSGLSLRSETDPLNQPVWE